MYSTRTRGHNGVKFRAVASMRQNVDHFLFGGLVERKIILMRLISLISDRDFEYLRINLKKMLSKTFLNYL